MDLCFLSTEKGVEIRPQSIHGILWLQTHFEKQYWDSLASNKVRLPFEDAEDLSIDAESAGISINCIGLISISGLN